VRPSDPARGCRDWLACLAAKRATPCSVTVWTSDHHRSASLLLYAAVCALQGISEPGVWGESDIPCRGSVRFVRRGLGRPGPARPELPGGMGNTSMLVPTWNRPRSSDIGWVGGDGPLSRMAMALCSEWSWHSLGTQRLATWRTWVSGPCFPQLGQRGARAQFLPAFGGLGPALKFRVLPLGRSGWRLRRGSLVDAASIADSGSTHFKFVRVPWAAIPSPRVRHGRRCVCCCDV
jgi:hypothetical protein